jgi:hypothetical protein
LAQAPGFGGGGPSSRAARSPCLRSELHGGALPTTVAGHAPSSRGERRSSKEKSQDPSPTSWRGSVPPTTRQPPSHSLLHRLPLLRDIEPWWDQDSAGVPLSSSTSHATVRIWRYSGNLQGCGGGRWPAPAQWWPAGDGSHPMLLFFFFLFCLPCVSTLVHDRDVGSRHLGMLDVVWKGPPSVAFFAVRRPWRMAKILNHAF